MTGKDRHDILKTVTAFLSKKNINIEDWYVEFEGDNVTQIGEITIPELLDIKQLQDEFQQCAAALGLKSHIQHENIFIATNEVGAVKPLLTHD